MRPAAWRSAYSPHPSSALSPRASISLLVALLIVAAVRVILRRQGRKKEKELIQTKMAFFTQVAHDQDAGHADQVPLERIIETGKWNSDVTSNLDMMKRNVDRLLELIRQLLDFRKVDSLRDSS